MYCYLRVYEVLDVLVSVGLPLVEAVHLVEGDDEGRLLVLQQVDRLDRLWFQRVHDVDDEDGHVAEGGAAVAQV